jgi:hypothetical protein
VTLYNFTISECTEMQIKLPSLKLILQNHLLGKVNGSLYNTANRISCVFRIHIPFFASFSASYNLIKLFI